MADCDVRIVDLVLTPRGVSGSVVVSAADRVPRARCIHLTLSVQSEREGTLEEVDGKIDLPPEGLLKGARWFPFALERTSDAAVLEAQRAWHRVDATIEIGWAPDPRGHAVIGFKQHVVAPPDASDARPPTARSRGDRAAPTQVDHPRTPCWIQSPAGYHPEIVLEIALASSTIAANEPIVGNVALRAGCVDDLVGVSFGLMSLASGTIHAATSVGREPLRGGGPVAFTIPGSAEALDARESYALTIAANLISTPVSWRGDLKHFLTPLRVLPAGSAIATTTTLEPIGTERLARIAHDIAARTSVPPPPLPALLDAQVGAVSVRLYDHAVGDELGAVCELRFPNLALGLGRELPEQPGERGKRELEDLLLGGLDGAVEVEVSDEHFRARFLYERVAIVELGGALHAKAARVRDVIAALPPSRSLSNAALDAWRAAAAASGGFFVPSVPAIHGVPFGAAVDGGRVVALFAHVRAPSIDGAPGTIVLVDLDSAPLPSSIDEHASIGRSAELMAALRTAFPQVNVSGARATLARPGFTDDPRTILPVLDDFLSWVLEVRQLRRDAGGPYR